MNRTKGKILFAPLLENYNILKNSLYKEGYELCQSWFDWHTHPDLRSIEYEKIKDFDAIVLDETTPATPIDSDVRSDIIKYVIEDDGGLLIIYDSSSMNSEVTFDVETPDSYFRKTNIRDLGKVFGISDLTGTRRWGSLDLTGTPPHYFTGEYFGYVRTKTVDYVLAIHPLTRGVGEIGFPLDVDIGMYKGSPKALISDFCPLVLNENSESLICVDTELNTTRYMEDPDKLTIEEGLHPIFAISKEYRVGAMSVAWCNDIFKDDSINHMDNKQFALNLFPWLCDKHIEKREIEKREITRQRPKRVPSALRYP